jgi:uncharacterized protein (DUF697 family)
MNQNTLLSIYEKLESLIGRLPQPLQNAILNELRPIKQIFLTQRLAKIVLLGQPDSDVSTLFSALLRNELQMVNPTSSTGWVTYEQRGKDGFRILDKRCLNESSLTWSVVAEESPDLFLFVVDGSKPVNLGLECERARWLLDLVETHHQSEAGVIGIIDFPVSTPVAQVETRRLELQKWLTSHPRLSRHFVRSVAICSFARFHVDGSFDSDRDARQNIDILSEILVRELPEESQVKLARLFHVRGLQVEIAQRLTRSVTAICATIGAQPMPLADFPVLAALQFAMVSGIMHISSQELGLKAATKFLGALGINLSIGVILRESTRTVMKLLPGWGSAISGGVAAAGTYAIGRVAIGYFIEEISFPKMRKLFRHKKLLPKAG